MAYDRYDTREGPRGERWRWRDERHGRDYRGREDERGFFERAGDEIASWFGDDEAERRRREDQRMEARERGWDRSGGRGDFEGDRRERERGYREYGRPGHFLAASGYARGGFGPEDFERERERDLGLDRRYEPMFGGYTVSQANPRTDYVRGVRSRDFDPHYHSWRQRQLDELDRDYDEFRRENQARFEEEFGRWRERRMQKRGLLGQIREHMEVVGNDDQHVGTIDCVAGDRIILTRSDPESGGVHHSLSCADIGRVEGDRVILDMAADQAKQRWRDEGREGALFGRSDQSETGEHMLNRSFAGTYR